MREKNTFPNNLKTGHQRERKKEREKKEVIVSVAIEA